MVESGVKAKLLVVDDEKNIRLTVSQSLEALEIPVSTAVNGEEALVKLHEGRFDIVFLDLKMPGMDGIAMMHEMRKLGLSTEVLILTGHGSIDTALEAIRLGAYDYATKPCEISDLVSKIEAAFERKSIKDKKGS